MNNSLHPQTREELRVWLAEHHATERECWISCRRGKPPADGALWYVDAVEEAICFGWIDATLKRNDAGEPMQKLLPRKRGSHWSELNKARARRMEHLGLMTDAGRAALPPPEPFHVDGAILSALRADGEAWEHFLDTPALYRRVRIDNIQSYRSRQEHFQRKLEKLFAMSRADRLYGEWSDYGRLTMFARDYFLQTARIGFSFWSVIDLPEARLLWGDPTVTRYICASGRFSEQEITARLQRELDNQERYGVQYWPLYRLTDGDLIGCCGLRPHGEGSYEMGVHLRSAYWRQGYATEAANAVIGYAFSVLGAERLFAGHNPNNEASRRLLRKLGFRYTGDEYYAPTGLYHPSYELKRQ